jgi:ABC-type polysaccharide/polyol phosphate export permease
MDTVRSRRPILDRVNSAHIVEGVAYPVFAFVGLAVWTGFSRALTNAADSLVTKRPSSHEAISVAAGAAS